VNERTAAIVVTHLYGIMVDVAALRSELHRCGWSQVRIVEDCAQAHGAALHGRKAGSLGDVAAFSFYPTKNLGALGDAGAVVTNDAHIADRVSRLHQYGWEERYRSTLAMGRNSRMDELQAAVLTVKLAHVDRWNAARRQVLARYAREIPAPMRLVGTPESSNAAHLAVFRSPERDRVRKLFAAGGISTDVHYPILDSDQISQSTLPGQRMPLPVSERAVGEILTLPCYAELTSDEIDKIILTATRICDEIAK
jgi:dTDP-4-amino-4,6-dideoxygalactose transaminase